MIDAALGPRRRDTSHPLSINERRADVACPTGKRLYVILCVAALLAACTGGPGASFAPAPTPASASQSLSIRPTDEPTPQGRVTGQGVDWGEWATVEDGTLVTVLGSPLAHSATCTADRCTVVFGDPFCTPSNPILLDMAATSATERGRNAMVGVAASDPGTDVVLITDDGSPLGVGDVVRVTGTFGHTVVNDPNSGSVSLEVETVRVVRLESGVAGGWWDEGTVVNIAALKDLPNGMIVKVRGRLRLGAYTFCAGEYPDKTCKISLVSPSNTTGNVPFATLIVSLTPSEQGYNEMMDLGSFYSADDLRVFAADGSVLGLNSIAWIVGTLGEDSDGTKAITVRQIQEGG